MRIINIAVRLILGVMLLIFGINKFFWFMPDFDFTGYPEAEHLFNALRFSGENPESGKGYILTLVGLTETTVGLLLVLKKWVPFALAMLVPISINIVAFHLMVNLPNIGPALFIAIINAYLIYKNRAKYACVFS